MKKLFFFISIIFLIPAYALEGFEAMEDSVEGKDARALISHRAFFASYRKALSGEYPQVAFDMPEVMIKVLSKEVTYHSLVHYLYTEHALPSITACFFSQRTNVIHINLYSLSIGLSMIEAKKTDLHPWIQTGAGFYLVTKSGENTFDNILSAFKNDAPRLFFHVKTGLEYFAVSEKISINISFLFNLYPFYDQDSGHETLFFMMPGAGFALYF